MNDPAWFYSSLAQVTAAFIGFVGGFIFLRLQQIFAGWRDLALRLQAAQMAWITARRNIRKRTEANIAVLPEMDTEVRRTWVELWFILKQRQIASLPRNLGLWVVLLLALSIVGIIGPLIALQEPVLSTRVVFLVPWSALVLSFVLLGYAQARTFLSRLKSVAILPSTQKEFDREEQSGKGVTLGFKEETE